MKKVKVFSRQSAYNGWVNSGKWEPGTPVIVRNGSQIKAEATIRAENRTDALRTMQRIFGGFPELSAWLARLPQIMPQNGCKNIKRKSGGCACFVSDYHHYFYITVYAPARAEGGRN